MDSTSDDLEQKGLLEAFELTGDELFEARHNLLGFYGTLQKIKWRLEEEGKL